MGSTKLLQVGLGKSGADEYQDNLSQLSATLTGSVGLFFTSLPHTEVRSSGLAFCVTIRMSGVLLHRTRHAECLLREDEWLRGNPLIS